VEAFHHHFDFELLKENVISKKSLDYTKKSKVYNLHPLNIDTYAKLLMRGKKRCDARAMRIEMSKTALIKTRSDRVSRDRVRKYSKFRLTLLTTMSFPQYH